MYLATDSMVGWSNSRVYGTCVTNSFVSALENSTATTESNPAAISGMFTAVTVLIKSRRDAEMTLAAEPT